MSPLRVVLVVIALMIVLVVGSGVAQVASSPSREEVFFSANRAYDDGSYEHAIDGYRALINLEDTGWLEYNLGNAYLRSGDLGRAIAAFLKAEGYLPRSRDVAANLRFARDSARDALTPPQPSTLARTLFFWHYHLSKGEKRLGLVVAVFSVWLAVALGLARRRFRRAALWLGAAGALGVLTGGSSLLASRFWPSVSAVVLPAEVEARSDITPTSVATFRLHAGAELRVEREGNEGVRVRLPTGEVGWLKHEAVEIVRR